MNVVYHTGHAVNESMSAVLAKGFNAKKRPACVRVTHPDGTLEFIPVKPIPGTTSIAYGILRGTGEILRECERTGENYIYCDHSYFKQHRCDLSASRQNGYFRLVQNDRYARDIGSRPSDRWEALGVKVKPWRKTGKHIVVVPVSRFVAAYNGFNASDWLGSTLAKLKEVTDRPVMIKPKDSDAPIEEVLDGAWALVTMESNAAIDALVAGVPVFAGVSAAVAPIANMELDLIESPPMGDREGLFSMLAYQQWTIDEIVSGEARESMGDGSARATKLQECSLDGPNVRQSPAHI